MRTLTLAAAALLAAGRLGAQTRDFSPYLIADRATEVALARSAAPSHVSDSASVLVLTRTGFVEAARGSNGFTCAVLRSFHGAIGDPAFWNPRVRAPHCFNSPAGRTILPESVKRAEWILAGASPAEVVERTKRAYASGELKLPAVGAMAYMLSPRQHLLDEDPHWQPHMMFYFDRSMPPGTWGVGDMTAPVIEASAGDPTSPVQVLLIPVPRWSDGKPAVHR